MKKIISAFLILQLVFVSFTFSGCHKNTTLMILGALSIIHIARIQYAI